MKRGFFLLFIILKISIIAFGQNFEGEIVYEDSLQSKKKDFSFNMKKANFITDCFFKKGCYKVIKNHPWTMVEQHSKKDNKNYYNYNIYSDGHWAYHDDSLNDRDEVLKTELRKNVIKIIDHECNELTLTCKREIIKFYFDSVTIIDTNEFLHLKFESLYNLILKLNAIPWKIITENSLTVAEMNVIAFIPMEIEDSFFELPPYTKTKVFSYPHK